MKFIVTVRQYGVVEEWIVYAATRQLAVTIIQNAASMHDYEWPEILSILKVGP